MHKVILGCLGWVALGSSVAVAAERVDSAAALLERMDRNVDGQISIEEYRNAMLRRFDASDENRDGSLSGDEFPPEWVAGADARAATGSITLAEFSAALQPVYERFDASQDGQLDAAEIEAMAAARRAQEEHTP